MCRLWVNVVKSLVVSSICSRAVQTSFESAICSYTFIPCRPSLCPKSNCHMLCFTFKLCYSFRVTDVWYIKALLWRVLFRRHQHIIRDWDLEIIQYLGTCMPQWQVSRFRQWVYIIDPWSRDSVECSTSTPLFTVDGLYYSTLGVIDINGDFPRTC